MLTVLVALAVVAIALPVAALALNRVPLAGAPGIAARLAIYIGSNVAQTGPDSSREELRPILLAGAPEALLHVLGAACRESGWHNVRIDRGALRVDAEATTPLLRFTDDVQVRLLPAPGGALEARVRSASRLGRGDLGANTRHVMDLRAALARAGVLAGASR